MRVVSELHWSSVCEDVGVCWQMTINRDCDTHFSPFWSRHADPSHVNTNSVSKLILPFWVTGQHPVTRSLLNKSRHTLSLPTETHHLILSCHFHPKLPDSWSEGQNLILNSQGFFLLCAMLVVLQKCMYFLFVCFVSVCSDSHTIRCMWQ